MAIYKGFWSFAPMSECTTKLVRANGEEEAVEKLAAWALAHASIVDEPLDFEVEEMQTKTYEELLHDHADAIVYAFNTGNGYEDMTIADDKTRIVFTAYMLVDDNCWLEHDEYGATGNTISWCMKHLCGSFPTWKLIRDPKVELKWKHRIEILEKNED